MTDQEQTNKELIITVATTLFGEKDIRAFDRYFQDPYIQHNPNVPDGIEASKKFLGAVLGNLQGDMKHMGVEGDLAYTHTRINGFGDVPAAVIDIFRMADGKIREHWDVMQPMINDPDPDGTVSDTIAPIETVDKEERRNNKRLAGEFFAGIFGKNKDLSVTDRLVGDQGMMFHHIGQKDRVMTKHDLRNIAQQQWSDMPQFVGKEIRSIADNDLVMLHVCGEQGDAGPALAMAHLFRVQGGKIVEYWSVKQEVPAESQNSNTMF